MARSIKEEDRQKARDLIKKLQDALKPKPPEATTEKGENK